MKHPVAERIKYGEKDEPDSAQHGVGYGTVGEDRLRSSLRRGETLLMVEQSLRHQRQNERYRGCYGPDDEEWL